MPRRPREHILEDESRDAWANVRFRLKGSTDETTQALWDRILDSIAGTRVVDLARLAPQILAGAESERVTYARIDINGKWKGARTDL